MGRKSRKPGRTTFLSVFKRARSKNHSYQCISKADPERESSSFARMGITAALTLLQAMKKRNGYQFLLSWPEVRLSRKKEMWEFSLLIHLTYFRLNALLCEGKALTHGTRGKELSTGMGGLRGWMSEIVFPLMDMKKDPLGCLTCPQKPFLADAPLRVLVLLPVSW